MVSCFLSIEWMMKAPVRLATSPTKALTTGANGAASSTRCAKVSRLNATSTDSTVLMALMLHGPVERRKLTLEAAMLSVCFAHGMHPSFLTSVPKLGPSLCAVVKNAVSRACNPTRQV